MLSQCTICNSKWKDSCNDLLEKGMPYSFVAAFLKDKGIDLSQQSISRHNKNHRLSNKKPKQIQKKGIIKARNKAKGNDLPPKYEDIRFQEKGHLFVKKEDVPPVCPETGFEAVNNRKDKELHYQAELEKMQQDIDVIKEYMEVLAIAKDRVKRGLHEEQESGLVLATTGNAVKDYAAALKNFHEITAGMESITKLRFAQLVQLVGNVFIQPAISDQTRQDLLKLMEAATNNPEPIKPVNEVDNEGLSIEEVMEIESSSNSGPEDQDESKSQDEGD